MIGLRTCDEFLQDYSKFVEDDFDVKEWVNNAFRAHKEGSNDVSLIMNHHPNVLF